MGLRDRARRTAQHIYVVDLGGDNKGARPEEGVFDIQTPVAIVFLVRTQKPSTSEAKVSHMRAYGQRLEKLDFLESLRLLSFINNSSPPPKFILLELGGAAKSSEISIISFIIKLIRTFIFK